MATFAYLFPPLTGLAAYFVAETVRVRFHGLQAIALGLLAAASLYGASAVSSSATPFVFALWLAIWVFLLVATLVGRDPRLPGLANLLSRAAQEDPRARP